jgi:hypothetical protein
MNLRTKLIEPFLTTNDFHDVFALFPHFLLLSFCSLSTPIRFLSLDTHMLLYTLLA